MSERGRSGVEFSDEQKLTLEKMSAPPHTETVLAAKQLLQGKSATIAAGKLGLSSANGIKLTGAEQIGAVNIANRG